MKWPRRILISLLILATLITALWWEENWRGQKIWEESCARLRAAGEPVQIADIIPPMIPDEENVAAAPIFAEVMASQSSGGTSLGRISEQWMARVSKSRLSFPRARPMSPSDLSFLDHWADFTRSTFPGMSPTGPFGSSAEEIIDHYVFFQTEWNDIRDALRRPECRWPLEYEDGLLMKTPHLMCLQPLPNTWRGLLAALAARGKVESFVEHLAFLFELERLIGKEPPDLLTHLVGITMAANTLRIWQDCLPLVQMSDSQLLKLQRILEGYSLREAAVALRNDRVVALQSYSGWSAGQLLGILNASGAPLHSGWIKWSWVEKIEESTFNAVFLARPRGWQLADLASYQDALYKIHRGCIDLNRSVVVRSEVDGMVGAAKRLADDLGWHTFTRHVLEDSVSMQHRVLLRTVSFHATVRCAIVWCAAERFRLRHGHFPQSLEDLVPEYLDAPLADPIDGRPLRFVLKSPQELLIYTLGWDGKDEGGVRGKRPDREGDVGWASDPTDLTNLHDLENWKDEDEERLDRLKASAQLPRYPKRLKRGTSP